MEQWPRDGVPANPRAWLVSTGRFKAIGWYRRTVRPYFEMRWLLMEDGERVTSYTYPLTQFFVYAGMLAGILLLAIEVIR